MYEDRKDVVVEEMCKGKSQAASKRRNNESFETVFVELPEKGQEHREEDGRAL